MNFAVAIKKAGILQISKLMAGDIHEK